MSGWRLLARPRLATSTSGKAFLLIDLSFEDAGEGRTRYVARAKHWSVADREAHEAMGFHQGWGVCADQPEELARSL